jgi:phthiocerol/phenolphthiocerol synthesis type-I polyketide synthase E
VIPQEYVHVACRSVDLALPAAGSPDREAALDRLAAQLLAEALAPALSEGAAAPAQLVALRGRRRFVRAHAPVALPALASPLRRDGVYLITDVSHGIGLPLARALRAMVGCRLALLLPPGAEPGERLADLLAPPTPPDTEAVLVLTADLTSEADLRAAAARVRERFGALSGVFHTAAAFSGGLLQLKTAATLPAVFGAQARGALAVTAAFAAFSMTGEERAEDRLDFLVLAASTAAVTGGFGQIDPTAAGALLAALAERETAAGRPVVTVDWDPYQWGSWLAAGLADDVALAAGLASNVELYDIAPAESLEALSRLLAAGLPHAVVSAEDLDAVIAQTDAFSAADLLAEMAKGGGMPAGTRRTSAAPYVPPGDELEATLAGIWQELFGIERIGVEDDFLALGGHSLLAIQVTTQVRNAFGVDLPVSALFEQPTLAGLARRIRAERGEAGEGTLETLEPGELDALLAQVEELSPEEVQALLAAERGVGAAAS